MFQQFVNRNNKWLFPFPAILFVLLLMVFPILYTVWNSFTGWSLTRGVSANFSGFSNYINLFTEDTRFKESVLHMIYFTSLALSLEVIIGVAVAIFLDFRDYPGKKLINSIFLLPMMATPVAVAMVWLLMFEPTAGIINFMFNSIGLKGQLWIAGSKTVIPSLVLVDVWEWTPLITIITLAGLTVLPKEPFEAAKIDGASPWQAIRYITLPLLMPTITIAAMLRLIDCLKTFDIIYTMTGGGPGFSSETLNIYTYNQGFYYFNFGYVSAILIIFLVIVSGFTLLVAYTRRGLEI